VSKSKYRALSETLSSAFTKNPGALGEKTDFDQLADLTDLEQALTEQLSGFPIEGTMKMSANESWLELSLSSEMLFESGSANPNESAVTLFSELADVLDDVQNEIQILGHTDDVPIRNEQFPNNWALSSARAVSIVNALAFQGIEPSRLSATGFGEYRPVADNTTEEGRSQNRRVVVRVGSRAASSSNQVENAGELIPQEQSQPIEDVETLVDIQNAEGEETPVEQNKALQNGIEPVRLKGGDLLFTSDPDLPRTREIEE